MSNAEFADKKEITVGDLRMVRYFWEEKGRLDAWSSYAEKLPALRREHPEIVQAYEQLKAAERAMNDVIGSLDLYPD